MMRIFLLGLALFLASKIAAGLFKSTAPKTKTTVKGESKKESLDISEEDIVDVDFKEVKE